MEGTNWSWDYLVKSACETRILINDYRYLCVYLNTQTYTRHSKYFVHFIYGSVMVTYKNYFCSFKWNIKQKKLLVVKHRLKVWDYHRWQIGFLYRPAACEPNTWFDKNSVVSLVTSCALISRYRYIWGVYWNGSSTFAC